MIIKKFFFSLVALSLMSFSMGASAGTSVICKISEQFDYSSGTIIPNIHEVEVGPDGLALELGYTSLRIEFKLTGSERKKEFPSDGTLIPVSIKVSDISTKQELYNKADFNIDEVKVDPLEKNAGKYIMLNCLMLYATDG